MRARVIDVEVLYVEVDVSSIVTFREDSLDRIDIEVKFRLIGTQSIDFSCWFDDWFDFGPMKSAEDDEAYNV